MFEKELLANNTEKLRNDNGYVYLGIYYNYLLGKLCNENPLGENFHNCKTAGDFKIIEEIITTGNKKTLCINEVKNNFKKSLIGVFAQVYKEKSIFEK